MEGLSWYPGEFDDVAALTKALDGYDVIFHLAHTATPRRSGQDYLNELQVNLAPTLALLEIVGKAGARKIIFVSSGGTVYGHSKLIPTPETAPTEPIHPYGVTKLAIEKYLALYHHLNGLDYRILRITNAYGPHQGILKKQGIIAALVLSCLSGEVMEIWGDGSAVRDFIYADDAAAALEAAMNYAEDKERVFNIGSGQGKSLTEVIQAIEQLSGRKANIKWMTQRSTDVPMSVVAIDRAKTLLGWQPQTTLSSGLGKTIAWWRTELGGTA